MEIKGETFNVHQFYALDEGETLRHFGVKFSDLDRFDIPPEIELYSFKYGCEKVDALLALEDVCKVLNHCAVESVPSAPCETLQIRQSHE